ncbi:hypothetical protein J4422_01045 [Candidatus Pacearchaeota archaeon]|nr:hypothetical protein [uncultured archaeon]MBS3086267.1 hypothetical protein [Candidatus Pacearchaeota archaeon]
MREVEQLRKLTDYIKKNLKKGYTLDSLRWALIGQGYSRTAVEKAVEQVNKELAKEAPVLKEKPVIRHEILDESNMPVPRKSWWERLFGM